jgi:hypothetical protein
METDTAAQRSWLKPTALHIFIHWVVYDLYFDLRQMQFASRKVNQSYVSGNIAGGKK